MSPTRCGLTTAVLGIVAMCAATGCETNSGSRTRRQKTSASPSPFTVVARYSANSLGLKYPRALAVGSNGNVYITDDSQRVTEISPEGRVLRRWGKRGTGPGEFRFVSTDPHDPTSLIGRITVGPTGMVYVSDSGNARVEMFTPQGRFIRQYGSLGTGTGQFLVTFDAAVDQDGDLYVLDGQRVGVLTKFSPGGKVVWTINGASSAASDVIGHLHLGGMDSHGRLVMFSEDNGLVVYVDRDGHEVDSFHGSGGAFPAGSGGCDVTVDAAGNTYVTGCGRGGGCPALICAGTVVFDRAHRRIAEFASANVPLFNSPRFGPNGEAFAIGQDGAVSKLRVTLPEG